MQGNKYSAVTVIHPAAPVQPGGENRVTCAGRAKRAEPAHAVPGDGWAASDTAELRPAAIPTPAATTGGKSQENKCGEEEMEGEHLFQDLWRASLLTAKYKKDLIYYHYFWQLMTEKDWQPNFQKPKFIPQDCSYLKHFGG